MISALRYLRGFFRSEFTRLLVVFGTSFSLGILFGHIVMGNATTLIIGAFVAGICGLIHQIKLYFKELRIYLKSNPITRTTSPRRSASSPAASAAPTAAPTAAPSMAPAATPPQGVAGQTAAQAAGQAAGQAAAQAAGQAAAQRGPGR